MGASVLQLPVALAGDDVTAIAADVLVLLGLVVTTLGVIGIFRMPDTYTQLHATSKAVFLGIIALLVASLATRDGSIAARALLIAGFLVLTTPVGAHVIARAAYRTREPMRTPGAIDESGELEREPESRAG
jgi:multicomponent Na+:H+ antiporter subunit G